MNSLSSAPIILTLANREAEIVTLRSNFYAFVASSKLIEDELEAELTNVLLSYINRTGSVFFLNRILKGAICAAKSKYEDEWTSDYKVDIKIK